jgi:hypothetical protein
MVTTLTEIFKREHLTWLTVSFDPLTGHFSFTGKQKFAIDTTYNSFDRPFDYGLGFNLGLTYACHISIEVNDSWIVTSDQCAYFSGDQYVLLKVNNFECVSHQTGDQRIGALAKIVLRDPKNFMTFDDYASQHAKEVTFTAPVDLTRFHIQLYDAYGYLLDMCASQFSFSMEILEVRNSSMYDTIRDSLTVHYV